MSDLSKSKNIEIYTLLCIIKIIYNKIIFNTEAEKISVDIYFKLC